MTYGELRAYFLDFLMRDDCTDEQADSFIRFGITRVERLLRTRFQHGSFDYPIPPDWDMSIPLPADYLGIRQVTIGGTPIPRITKDQIRLNFPGYTISGNALVFDVGTEGESVVVDYITSFLRSTEVDDQNDFLTHMPDVIVYAALVAAADFYMDTRKSSFEGTLASLISEVREQHETDELSGGQFLTPYGLGVI